MITYSVISMSKATEAVKFLMDNFCVEEPIGRALDLPISQFERWFPSYITKSLAESISVMAVDSETNSIVGVCVGIILDPSSPPETDMGDCIDDEKEPTMALIARLLSNNWNNNPCQPKEKTLIYQFLSVNKMYARRGIAKELIDSVERRALEFGDINSAQVDATSHYSFRAYQQRGYEVILETKYTSIEDGGIRPLESKVDKLGVHTHLRLLLKAL